MIQKTEKWKIPEVGLWGFSHCGSHDTWYPWSSLSYEGKLSRLLKDESRGRN